MPDTMPETLLVYGHIKVLEVVDFFLTASTGELNEVAWRLVAANPDIADDVALRILNAGETMTPEQADRIWQAMVGNIDDDKTTDTNNDSVPGLAARPHQRRGLSSTAD